MKRLLLLSFVLLVALPAGAQPPPPASEPEPTVEAPAPPPSPEVRKARELFLEGVTSVKQAKWNRALAAFEQSSKLRPHATTTFNIGACERAIGRYTAARGSFERALSENAQRPGELAASLKTEAEGFLREMDGLLAQVRVTIQPAQVSVAVDGRPLRAERAPNGAPRYVAGVEPPGKGQPAPPGSFLVVLNPGAHVFTISRKGFTDAVVNRTFAPGARESLELQLARLPARLRVSSNVNDSIVSVNGKDFGPVPVEVLRPAGNYRVVVSRSGYEPYEAQVAVQAGEESALEATLREKKTPITKRWWFWTGAAVIVAGGIGITYAVTRSDPKPPPYEGGSTGWVVFPQAVRF